MNKKQLAEILRKRQFQSGYVSEEKVMGLTDEQIIKSYILCSNCGKWIIDFKEAIELAKRSKNFDGWWKKIHEVSAHGC